MHGRQKLKKEDVNLIILNTKMTFLKTIYKIKKAISSSSTASCYLGT
jgi:hypothetical protein